ncbi:hypothetical protein WA158_001134 [Blastocystis sp. Blastoise]
MDKLKSIIDQYANSVNQEETQKVISQAIALLNNGNMMSTLISACEFYLVNSEESKRKIGMKFLGDIISSDDIHISVPVITSIYEFFLIRIEDFPTAEECTNDIYVTIKKYGLVIPDSCIKTVEVFSQTGNIGSMKYPCRHHVYDTLSLFLSNNHYHNTMVNKGLQYVKWLCNIMLDEKDPRGLLQVLQLVESICTVFDSILTLDISGEIFDILSSYFPVTFTRPANDVFNITHEDIKNALNTAFLVSSHLQEFLLPFLLDRIDSGIYNNQRDGLELLLLELQQYGTQYLMRDLENWETLLLVNTCISGLDDVIQNASRQVLGQITANLHKDYKDILLDGYITPFLELPKTYILTSPNSLTAHNTMKVIKILLENSSLCLPPFLPILNLLIDTYKSEGNVSIQYIPTLVDIYIHGKVEQSQQYSMINGLLSLLYLSQLSHCENSLLSHYLSLFSELDASQYIYISSSLNRYIEKTTDLCDMKYKDKNIDIDITMNSNKNDINSCMSVNECGEVVRSLFTACKEHIEYGYLLDSSLLSGLSSPSLFIYLYTQIETALTNDDTQVVIDMLNDIVTAMQKSRFKEQLAIMNVEVPEGVNACDSLLMHMIKLVLSRDALQTSIEFYQSVYIYMFHIIHSLPATFSFGGLVETIFPLLEDDSVVPQYILFHFLCCIYDHIPSDQNSLFINTYQKILIYIQQGKLLDLPHFSILCLYIYIKEDSLPSLLSLFPYQDIHLYIQQPNVTTSIIVGILQSLYIRSSSSLPPLLLQLNTIITSDIKEEEKQFYLAIIGKVFSPLPPSITSQQPNLNYVKCLATESFPLLFNYIKTKNITLSTSDVITQNDMLLLRTVFLFSLFLPSEVLTPHVTILLPLIIIDLQSKSPSNEAFKLIYNLSVTQITKFVDYIPVAIPLLITVATTSSNSYYRLVSLFVLHRYASLPKTKIALYIDTVIFKLKTVLDDPQRVVRSMAGKTINLWSVCKSNL